MMTRNLRVQLLVLSPTVHFIWGEGRGHSQREFSGFLDCHSQYVGDANQPLFPGEVGNTTPT